MQSYTVEMTVKLHSSHIQEQNICDVFASASGKWASWWLPRLRAGANSLLNVSYVKIENGELNVHKQQSNILFLEWEIGK